MSSAMDWDVQSTSTVTADSVVINIASSGPQDCSMAVNASAAAFKRANAQSTISVPNDAEDATEDDAFIVTVSSNSSNRRRSFNPFGNRPPGFFWKLCRHAYRDWRRDPKIWMILILATLACGSLLYLIYLEITNWFFKDTINVQVQEYKIDFRNESHEEDQRR